MSLPQSIQNEFEQQCQHRVLSSAPCGGGDSAQAFQLRCDDGGQVFLKLREDGPDDYFHCEATGLQHLQQACPLAVPTLLGYGHKWLALEWLATGQRGAEFEARLAAGLAAQHDRPAARFGFVEDNYCGLSRQLNDCKDDGYAFFAECRLLVQIQRAYDAGLLGRELVRKSEALCQALPELIPLQQAALLHGDLWQGNVLTSEQGQPALIDPACYWGWPEADLAMMFLFGGFSEDFLAHYNEHRELPPGLAERLPIYNLYHLLNHLNLFGGSYLGAVKAILKPF